MSTAPEWEPRPGPTRGDPARRAPRGSGGLARDGAGPRQQGDRGGAPAGSRGWETGPSFTPGRGAGPRDGGPGGPRPQRGGQGRPAPNSDGYDRRGPRQDDFAGRPRSSGESRAVDRNGPAGDQIGFDGYRSGGPARRLGRMSTWNAMLVLAAGTLLGIIATLVSNQEPGDLLGFFIIVGAIGAGLGIRRGKVYLLFPAPALAFFAAAVVTGKVHDAKLGSSTAGLGAGFTQWVANIFFPAVVATIVVLLVGGGRWVLGRQLVIGQSLSADRPAPGNARPAPGPRRPAVDDWADDNPFGDSPLRSAQPDPSPGPGTGPSPRQGTGPAPRQGTGPGPRQGTGPAPRQGTGPAPRQGTGPAPRQGTGPAPQQGTGAAPRQGTGSSPGWQGGSNGARPSRPSRDQRADRDPWGDPRLPEDRSQPAGPRPRPNGQGRPARQSDSGSRPSWTPAPSPAPQRPSRRQPPEGWAER
jgi:Domain of unknown function (DUF6542)